MLRRPKPSPVCSQASKFHFECSQLLATWESDNTTERRKGKTEKKEPSQQSSPRCKTKASCHRLSQEAGAQGTSGCSSFLGRVWGLNAGYSLCLLSRLPSRCLKVLSFTLLPSARRGMLLFHLLLTPWAALRVVLRPPCISPEAPEREISATFVPLLSLFSPPALPGSSS